MSKKQIFVSSCCVWALVESLTQEIHIVDDWNRDRNTRQGVS
jgi:hypothetical protein